MAEANTTRGPDGTFLRLEGPFGAGICRLDTTPEAPFETLPLHDSANGLTVVADVRLDNRDELLAALMPDAEPEKTGDTALIAAAWQRWGEDCAEHLTGDFAFCIFDAGQGLVFCARDRLGVKPFNYAWLDGRAFLFGTDDVAVAVHPLCPRGINEERFADHLTGLFEGADIEATFFKAVQRLPAAHVLVVRDGRHRIRRYWTFEPPPELVLPDDDAYADAFLRVFENAVRRRMRGGAIIGSMLSGGMDSGAVSAVAAPIFKASIGERLKTFSAINTGDPSCVETAHALASAHFLDVEAHYADLAKPEEWLDAATAGFLNMGSPFDSHMNLIRATLHLAHEAGCKVVLTGVNGDVALHASAVVARKIGAGDWGAARRLLAEDRMEDTPFWRIAFSVMTPVVLRRFARPLRRLIQSVRILGESKIVLSASSLRIIYDRGTRFDAFAVEDALTSAQRSSVAANTHPNVVVACERYDRVAAESGMEVRDPFTDVELLSFCASLPDVQKVQRGVRKSILRRAMMSLLPAKVRERTSKEHLGHAFSDAIVEILRKVNISLTTNKFGALIRVSHCDIRAEAADAGEYRTYWFALERWLVRMTGNRAPT